MLYMIHRTKHALVLFSNGSLLLCIDNIGYKTKYQPYGASEIDVQAGNNNPDCRSHESPCGWVGNGGIQEARGSIAYSYIFPLLIMPKQAITPKSRSKSHTQSARGPLSKQMTTSASKISKRPKGSSKSIKLKNEALSEQLDDLFGELAPHLASKTQKKKKGADLVSDIISMMKGS